MTVTLDPAQLVAVIVGLAALCAALGYLAHKVRQAWRVLHALAIVVQRELTPNGGKSIKDDSTGVAVAVGWLGRGFDDLTERFEDHLRTYHHHPEEIQS